MEAVVLHRVAFLEYFCPKQGQDFKPLATPLYPNMGQVPPRVSDRPEVVLPSSTIALYADDCKCSRIIDTVDDLELF